MGDMSYQALRIRKQMFDLSDADFKEYAAWEFCLDEEGVEGQDEETVRPSSLRDIPGNSFGSYLVAADVAFGDGSKASGYLFSDESDVVSASPLAFMRSEKVMFQIPGSFSPEKAEERKECLYSQLGMDRASVFPVTFTSLVPVNGSPMRFVLDGFVFNGGPRKGQTIR
jgi:hypothetical protein